MRLFDVFSQDEDTLKENQTADMRAFFAGTDRDSTVQNPSKTTSTEIKTLLAKLLQFGERSLTPSELIKVREYKRSTSLHRRQFKFEEGVVEGHGSEELANEVYAEFERTYPNLARRADERTVHAAIMDVLNYGGDSNPSALAQDVARAVKQEMQQGVDEAAAPVTHRIGLTVTDPNHPMVSKRGETYQKSVRVTGPDREAAINQAIAHYRRKGYKVHDHHYLGTVDKPMAEATGDKPFDQMMTTIKRGTNKQKTADRKEQQKQTQQQARNAFGNMFGGGNPADKLKIREQGVAEDSLNEDPVIQFASKAHNEWRKNFDPTGTKERIKKNSDGTEGNINVPFEELHPDWKKENLAAGQAAMMAVKRFPNNIEQAAEYIHNEWMKRNPKADYNAAQHVAYDQLPEDEKEKDRVHVRTMMSLSGKQGVAEGLDEAVGGNYLYHATSADGLKGMLSSGSIRSATGPQAATSAQTTLPTVSVTRDWGYASGVNTQTQMVSIGRDAILVLDRNAVESNFKTLGTSQSTIVKGLSFNPYLKKDGEARSQNTDPMARANAKAKMKYAEPTAKAGGEFEEAVVVPKGALPLKGTMVGFWVNPKSELMKDPAIINDPRRLDMPRPNQFVKATQAQGVAEGAALPPDVIELIKKIAQSSATPEHKKAMIDALVAKHSKQGVAEGPQELPQWKKDWYAQQKPNSWPKHPQPYHNPNWIPSPEELKKLRGEGVAEGSLNEFAQGNGGGDSGNYFRELASAWYTGAYNSGSLQKGIKTNKDIERLLQRGIVAPDGVTRKYNIDYNSDFDGVIIFSDDYYEHGDDDETDSRTGKPFGLYDYMEFSDDELSESLGQGVAEASNTMQRYGQKILKRAKAARAAEQAARDAESEPKKEEPPAPSVTSPISTRDLMQQLRRPKKKGVAEARTSVAVRLGRAIERTQGKTAASQARSIIPSSIPKKEEPKKDEKKVDEGIQAGDGFIIECGDSAIETVVLGHYNDGILIEFDHTATFMLTDAGITLTEAEYQGRTVPLGKRMAGDVKKSKVYVKKPNGNVVKVNFGDKNMTIKKHLPKHRKSYRARHHCENPGPKWKANYWSCRAW